MAGLNFLLRSLIRSDRTDCNFNGFPGFVSFVAQRCQCCMANPAKPPIAWDLLLIGIDG